MLRLLSGLRTRLILLVLLAVGPAFIILVYSAANDRERERSEALENAKRLARLASIEHERLIDGTHQLLTALAQLPPVLQLDSEVCEALFREILEGFPVYTNIAAVKPDGDMFCSGAPRTGHVNIADRPYFQRCVSTRELAVSEYLIGRTTGKPNVTLAHPAVDDSGVFKAVVFAALDLAWLNQLAAEAQLPEGSVLSVIDSHGTVLARNLEPEKWIGKTLSEAPIVKAILARQGDGTVETSGLDGITRLYAFTALRGSPAGSVFVSIGIPSGIAFAEVEGIFLRDMTIMGAFAALALLAAWVGGDLLLVRRVKALVRASRRLADGDLKARTGLPYGLSELSELSRAFDRMADSLQKRDEEKKAAEARLQEREAMLHALVESNPESVALINTNGTVLYANQAVAARFNKTVEELVGKCVYDVLPQDVAAQRNAHIAQVIASGKPAHFQDERGGRFMDNYLHPVLDPEGRVTRLAILGIDLTEHKRVEEAVRQSAARAEALARFANRLNAQLDMDAVLESACQEAAHALGVPAASITLYDEHTQELYLAATYGLPPQYRERNVPTPQAILEAYRTQKDTLAIIPDIRALPDLPNARFYAECDIRTVGASAMFRDGKPLGTLNVYTFGETRPFSEDEVALLRGLTDQATTAIVNARLYEEAKARSEELSAISSLSSHLRQAQTADEMLRAVLREVQRLFDAESAAVTLLDRRAVRFTVALGTGRFEPNIGRTFSMEDGASGLVLRTGQPYVTEDYPATTPRVAPLHYKGEIGPAAFVPMRSEVEFLGSLAAARDRGPDTRPFSANEVRLLTTIGEMAGNALRRARLFDDARRRLDYMDALNSVDKAIMASVDLRVTLDIVLDQVTTRLNLDAASVLLLDPHTHIMAYAAGRGFRSRAIERPPQRLGVGPAGTAAAVRGIVNIPCLQDAPESSEAAFVPAGEGFIAYYAVPLIAKGQVKGVLEVFHRAPLDPDEEWLDFLEALAGQAAIAIDNASLFSDLQRSNVELIQAYDTTLEGWSRALDLRDKETEGHSERVTHLTMRLADVLGIGKAELLHVRRGALLHDIGKMGIPDAILLKPGPLTDEEWVVMRQHPVYAFELLSPISYLRPALDIPYCHHEKWDGTGYPRGLKGEQIPLPARIFGLVDAWDALRSDRPYRPAWSEERAIDHIREQSGKHFDPKVVEAFLRLMDET